MRRSRLPAGGANVFQNIRAKRSEALDRGQALLDLSIGEPKGAALLSALEAARDAFMSNDEPMHAYQIKARPAEPNYTPR